MTDKKNTILLLGGVGLAIVISASCVVAFWADHDESLQAMATINAENGHAETIHISQSDTSVNDGASDTTKTTVESLAGKVAKLQAELTALETGDGIVVRNTQQEQALLAERKERARQMDEMTKRLEALKQAIEAMDQTGGSR